jgi:hypothetical protein
MKKILLLTVLAVITLAVTGNNTYTAAEQSGYCGMVMDYAREGIGGGPIEAHAGEGQGEPWVQVSGVFAPVITHDELVVGYWTTHYNQFPFGPYHEDCD